MCSSDLGRLQGALGSLQGIAMMMSPILLSQIFASAIQRGGKDYSGAPFAFTGLLMFAALALAVRATRSSVAPVAATATI